MVKPETLFFALEKKKTNSSMSLTLKTFNKKNDKLK